MNKIGEKVVIIPLKHVDNTFYLYGLFEYVQKGESTVIFCLCQKMYKAAS